MVSVALVQMMEKLLFFELLLCIYCGNGCAARGPAGFIRSALTRRIVLSDGNVDVTSNTQEKLQNPSEKLQLFPSFGAND